ncbi:uncharacterized protein TNCV_1892221 [Trichonephila clavipes]|nr:uncharacterized protein TNCV_1892221 [Trichonephila clavipes]
MFTLPSNQSESSHLALSQVKNSEKPPSRQSTVATPPPGSLSSSQSSSCPQQNVKHHQRKTKSGPTPETTLKLEEEAAGLDEQIKALEGNMSELLPCPVSLCAHNFKYKNNKERSAEPILRPAKLTLKNNNDKSKNLDDEEFKLPRKTSKGTNVPKEDSKIIATKNKFAALNAADKDVEVVTPAAPRIKPIMMKLFPEYNLILQEIHRTHPTATNTHVGGWIKIQTESSDHHREITSFLSDKNVNTTSLTHQQIGHSKWS